MATSLHPCRVGLLMLTMIGAPLLHLGAQVGADSTRPLPPATKLEAFQPEAGSVVTLGYTELGGAGGVSVDARELRDVKGEAARGLVFEIREGQYRVERSMVDEEEIPELLQALDALLAVTANPTKFKSFEVRYETRGGLRVVAFNGTWDRISYTVRVGRTLTASALLGVETLRKLRSLIATGQTTLQTLRGL